MTHLIDKDMVAAEINRVLDSYDPNEITSGRYALVNLRSFLNTLEVKEINSTDAFIKKARKYFIKELPNFRSFMENGTAFIKNFVSFIQGE